MEVNNILLKYRQNLQFVKKQINVYCLGELFVYGKKNKAVKPLYFK